MTLREQLDADLKTAMKARDQVKLDTIRSVKSAIKYKEVEGENTVLDDDGILKIIGTLIKQRRDAAEQFRAGNRPELAEKEETELGYLQAYLPKQMSEAEVAAEVDAVVKEVGASSPKDMGAVMKALLPRVTGKADGRLVSELVKKRLTQG